MEMKKHQNFQSFLFLIDQILYYHFFLNLKLNLTFIAPGIFGLIQIWVKALHRYRAALATTTAIGAA